MSLVQAFHLERNDLSQIRCRSGGQSPFIAALPVSPRLVVFLRTACEFFFEVRQLLQASRQIGEIARIGLCGGKLD